MSNVIKFAFLFSVALLFSSCEEKETKMSDKKPYSLVLKKERSYYQAEKITRHLNDLGIKSYIVESGPDDDTWYYVVSGAFRNKDEIERFKREELSKLNVHPDSVLEYGSLSEDSRKKIEVNIPPKREVRRIPAKKPDVPAVIFETIGKVPESNAFYVRSMGIVNFSQGHYSNLLTPKIQLDLPRGVSLNYIKGIAEVFSEFIMKDNLYEDNITMEILRLKRDQSSIVLIQDIADKILGTGQYEDEKELPIEADAYTHLKGYKVSFVAKTKKGERKRAYYILGDSANEFIFIVQSVEKNEADIYRFIGEIGKGNGLNDYNEFWNSFYLMPNDMPNDIFLAYSSERLGWSYAKSKGYAPWAKRHVGHWAYSMFFYDKKKKNIWHYSLFDGLSGSYNAKSWSLYNKAVSGYREKRKFCGTTGFVEPEELSYVYDRYILLVNPFPLYNTFLTKKELINKAENFQYVCR